MKDKTNKGGKDPDESIDKELPEPASAEEVERLKKTIKLLSESARLAKHGHAVWNEVNDVYIYVSEEYAHIFGYSADEFVARFSDLENDLKLVHPDDLELYLAYLEIDPQKNVQDIQYRIVRSDNEVRHILQRFKLIPDMHGHETHSLISIQDITEQVEREKELQRHNKLSDLLGHIISSAALGKSSIDEILTEVVRDVCMTTDWQVSHVYEVVNNRHLQATNIWYVEGSEFSALVDSIKFALHKTGAGLPERVLHTREAIWISDVIKDIDFIRAMGSKSPVKTGYAIPIMLGDQMTQVIEFYSRDAKTLDELLLATMENIGKQIGRVVERKKYTQKLLFRSDHDALTGLYNRGYFINCLEERHGQLEEGQHYQILYLDLDGFKPINDDHGHAWGDAVLIQVAQRLTQVTTNYDQRNGSKVKGVVARLGGDEFGILVQATPESGARLAKDLIEAISSSTQMYTYEDKEVKSEITASIGLHAFTKYDTPGGALGMADAAMYEAKEEGDRYLSTYDAVIVHLPEAIENGELNLVFQPIETEGIYRTYEGLMRWKHPTKGDISTDNFIGIAERTFPLPLTEIALEQSCQFVKNARKIGYDIRVAVNFPVTVFRDEYGIVTLYQKILEKYDVDPTCIDIEISEAIPTTPASIDAITRMADLGSQIVLDDWDVSGITTMLEKFPIHKVKIDRGGIKKLLVKGIKQNIVLGLIDFAKNSVKVEITAEGIDDELVDVLPLIKGKVDHRQGYLYGRPMPPEQAFEFMEKNNVPVYRCE
jgi:diguanylate cyclase (GGDEF)-like protein/PAS domain S-box-containing protein